MELKNGWHKLPKEAWIQGTFEWAERVNSSLCVYVENNKILGLHWAQDDSFNCDGWGNWLFLQHTDQASLDAAQAKWGHTAWKFFEPQDAWDEELVVVV